jgi:hypothetical protein
MKTLEGGRRARRADLILTGVRDVPAEAMLSVAEALRHALARVGVASVSVRVLTDDGPDLPDGA